MIALLAGLQSPVGTEVQIARGREQEQNYAIITAWIQTGKLCQYRCLVPCHWRGAGREGAFSIESWKSFQPKVYTPSVDSSGCRIKECMK